MVKKDNSKKNITFNLGSIPANIEGGKIKKKRGRPRKTEPISEVIVKEQLPHKKFSHKANRALDQLLEATREKEKQEAEKSLRDMIKKQTASLNVLGFGMKGGALEDDFFKGIEEAEKETEMVKSLPQVGQITLKLPPFFAVPTKKGWRLANPLTEMRNLATRQHKLSVNLERANVKKPEIDMSIPRSAPTLNMFSKRDQEKLKAYMEAVKEGREQEYLFKNKPRGFPAVLYKNAKKAGYKETKEKVYRKNDLKPKKVSKVPQGRPVSRRRLVIEGESDEEGGMEDEEKVAEQREAREERKSKTQPESYWDEWKEEIKQEAEKNTII